MAEEGGYAAYALRGHSLKKTTMEGAGAGRRGNELAEISRALRTFASKGKPTKEMQIQRRDLFKKVISYLTINIDMSSLFSVGRRRCASLILAQASP